MKAFNRFSTKNSSTRGIAPKYGKCLSLKIEA